MQFKDIVPVRAKCRLKTSPIFWIQILAISLALSFISIVSLKIKSARLENEILFSTSIVLIFLFFIFIFYVIHTINRSNKETQEHIQWLNNLVENSPLGIFLTDDQGKIQYINPKFTADSGYKTEDCIGKNPRIFKSGLQKKALYKNLWKTIKNGKIWSGELANYKKNGELYWSEMYIVPIIDAKNRVTNFIASKKDISKEKILYDELNYSNHMLRMATKTLQEHEEILEKTNRSLGEMIKMEAKNLIEKEKLLMHQSKMAAIGEMIGMIAHQWRQPLNAISAATIKVNMLNELETLSSEELSKTLKFIQDMSQKMSSTINDFMDFSNPEREKEIFHVMDVLNTALNIIDAQLRTHNITLKIDIEDNVHMNTYRRELAHILLNLLSNARDAFETKNISDKIITIRINDATEHIIITISDNAGGIPEEIMDKIFEPYFTTKSVGKGTGMGLYMNKKLLQEHFNGVITATNTEGGAEFKIMLPK